jgi:nitrogen permease regulator 3-like protein
MVIPPLHQRDTYIVSPNADMSKFKSACKAYNAAFPTLPGLAAILGALSGIPKPWMRLIPSSDHKEAYYEILAWLMKGGWVTQLRTFAYVRVSPEVKKAVREQEKKERLEKKASETITKSAEKDDEEENVDADADENGDTISNGNVNPRSFASDTNSQGSRRPSLMSRPSSDQRQHTMSSKAVHDPNAASLILNPSRASPLECKWLDHIANSLVKTQYSPAVLSMEEREELRMYWLRFVKYFNGSEPLEFIPVREGLKRKFVWDLLEKMGLGFDGGVETDGGGERASGKGKILVTIRHW